MATPVTCGGSTPRVARSVWMKTPYSSAVCSRRVVSRHETRSREPLNTPTLVFVLPTSMTSSMALLHRHVARNHAHDLPTVRADHERPVAPEVHGHPFPPVRRPRAAANALGSLEPRLADPLQTGAEESSIPPVEGGEDSFEDLTDDADPTGLHSDGGGEIAQRARKLRLIDVEADAEDDVIEHAGRQGRRLREHAADLPLAHQHIVGPTNGGAKAHTRPQRVGHRDRADQRELRRARRRQWRTEDHRHEQALSLGVDPAAAAPPAPGRLMGRRYHRALGGARRGEMQGLRLRGIHDAQRVDAVAEPARRFGQAHWSAARLALSLARICCCSSRRPRVCATTSGRARSAKSGRPSLPSRKAISLRARSISLPSRARSAPRSTTPWRCT